MKYKSLWVRDSAMMAESGLISPAELKSWINLICRHGQNGRGYLALENGLSVRPWAIADHITFDGKPIYFPGPYVPGKNQGNSKYGSPPHDNQYYFIDIVFRFCSVTDNYKFLNEKMKGVTLLNRLEMAFNASEIDFEKQLCRSDIRDYSVDWGFCDAVTKSGCLLFPSLLRYRSARQLAEIHSRFGNISGKEKYELICRKIKSNIMAFVSNRLMEAYTYGNAVNRGYVRHMLTDEDYDDTTSWQKASSEYMTYQNGGYWATPTGWYAFTLFIDFPDKAIRLLEDFIAHTKEFTEAPFEWRNEDESDFSGKIYGTSAALPFAAAKRIRDNFMS